MFRLIGGMELTTRGLKLHPVIQNAHALKLKVNLWHWQMAVNCHHLMELDVISKLNLTGFIITESQFSVPNTELSNVEF